MTAAPPISDVSKVANPYLGPRPFTQADAGRFFGRDREAGELYSLVAAHRTVLVYAQSGAGKTSLLNAGLIPMLEKGGFDVLPAARVSGMSSEDALKYKVKNVYVLNFADVWAEQSISLNTTLPDVLASRARRLDPYGELLPRVAIFDQFEELFTVYPERWPERRAFFQQLNEAMTAEPALRVLFAMREDFVAQIDPYEDLLPEQFRTRYRLEKLRKEAALAAVEKPLDGTGIRFGPGEPGTPGVAELLVRDLLRTVSGFATPTRAKELSSPPDGRVGGASLEAEFVEPVQLQVVCFSLFRNLPEGATEITKKHLTAFGDVDQALHEFYQSALKDAAGEARIEEDSLRHWFESKLITESGSRGLVLRSEETTGGIPNKAVDVLDKLHIIRAEVRGKDLWYELSHDRFVRPILRANGAWRARFQEAESRRARRALRRTQVVASFFVLLFLLALAAAFLAWRSTRQAQAAEQRARTALARSSVQDGEHSLDAGRQNEALAYFARALRIDGSFEPARGWISDLLLRSRYVLRPFQGRFSTVVLHHEGPVYSAAFSPDGKWVVTASDDYTAQVWEAASGKAVGQPLRHEGPVNSAAFSPDGKWVVTASLDKTARVWEAASGKAVGQPLRHESIVNSAAFSPDGKWVVTASADRTARVWEALVGSREDSPLLAELAEVISGYEVTESGTLQPTDNALARLHRLHEIADRAAAGEPTAASFLKWFFSPPGERTISPGFKVPVCDYIRGLVEAGRTAEAENEFPGYDRLCTQ